MNQTLKHTPIPRARGPEVQIGPESIDLGFIQRMKLRFFGIVNIGDRMDEGWSSSLPVYAFRCKTHGLQIGYPNGYSKVLVCPECVRTD